MKRMFSLVAILAIIIASNCSRIPENNDPIIGIWQQVVDKGTEESGKGEIGQEWIFNDAYLGRYHRYEGSRLAFKTDFKWEISDGEYTISYPGTDMPEQVVIMKETEQSVTLEDQQGNILATRN